MRKKNKPVYKIFFVVIIAAVLLAVILIYCGKNRANVVSGDYDSREAGKEIAHDDASVKDTEKDTEKVPEGGEVPKVQDLDVYEEELTQQEIQDLEEDEPVSIIFTGDVYLPEYLQAAYTSKGISGIMTEELQDKLRAADILMINNEFPFSTRGSAQDKQYTFRLNPSFVTVLTDIGVDIASLANNHSLDYGKDALTDTFSTLDLAGIMYAGAGETIERAKQIQTVTINGKKYGFIAVSRVVPEVSWKVEVSAPGVFSCYDDTQLIEVIKEAREECDYVAVFVHWGVERNSYPEDYQRNIAKDCIDAGADAVIGAHSHCLQSIEYIDGKPVFYSLGNFIFSYNIDMSAVLEVTINPNQAITYRMVPVYTANGVTTIAEDDKADTIISHLNTLSETAQVLEDGLVEEK